MSHPRSPTVVLHHHPSQQHHHTTQQLQHHGHMQQQEDCEMHVCGDEGHQQGLGFHASQSARLMGVGGASGEASGGASGASARLENNGTVKKRKVLDFNLVSEKMKRCRIAVSPGELRVRKDLEQLAAMQASGADALLSREHVRILRTNDPLVIEVHFDDSTALPAAATLMAPTHHHLAGGPSSSHFSSPAAATLPPPTGSHHQWPRHFSVKIPRMYPHSAPLVTSLQNPVHSAFASCIRSDGHVLHPSLQKNWTALMSFRDVIEALVEVRRACASGVSDSAAAGRVARQGSGSHQQHHNAQHVQDTEKQPSVAAGDVSMNVCS